MECENNSCDPIFFFDNRNKMESFMKVLKKKEKNNNDNKKKEEEKNCLLVSPCGE